MSTHDVIVPSQDPAESSPANRPIPTSATSSHSFGSTGSGKLAAAEQITRRPAYHESLFESRKRGRSTSVDRPNTASRERSSFASLWNPTNTSIHSTILPFVGSQPPSNQLSSSSHGPERPPIRKTQSLPLRPQEPPSDPSSLYVETSQPTSHNSPASGDTRPRFRSKGKQPLRRKAMPPSPTLPPKDPELGNPLPTSDTSAPNPSSAAANEIAWGPSHPCYPHPNPHVPLSSPLQTTTRIIRIKRDWMIVGDLAPTFSNIYPEILEPWVSEADFRSLVQHVNEGLIKAFHPTGWRAWMDALLGVATGWIWEDLGMSGVKSGCKSVERWIEQWNGRDSKGDEDGDTDGAKVIPLRRTGYLSLDIQIPDPHVDLVDSAPDSKPSTRSNSVNG